MHRRKPDRKALDCLGNANDTLLVTERCLSNRGFALSTTTIVTLEDESHAREPHDQHLAMP